jgi:hypothetical protein
LTKIRDMKKNQTGVLCNNKIKSINWTIIRLWSLILVLVMVPLLFLTGCEKKFEITFLDQGKIKVSYDYIQGVIFTHYAMGEPVEKRREIIRADFMETEEIIENFIYAKDSDELFKQFLHDIKEPQRSDYYDRERRKIRGIYRSYLRQYEYSGLDDISRTVHVNFFPDGMDNRERMEKSWFVFFDGGYYFWSIRIDLKEKKIIDFRINGYA